MSDAPCMRIADLARRWSCSQSYVRTLISKGALPAIRPGGRLVRISVAAVLAHEAKCETIVLACAPAAAAPHNTSVTAAFADLRAQRIARRLMRRLSRKPGKAAPPAA